MERVNPTDLPTGLFLAEIAAPRSDENSLIAHEQLVRKAALGGIDLYFVGDSITRRWGASDPIWRPMLENWIANFRGWNAGNFGWGGDETQHILWRLQNGELDGVNPKVIVVLAGTNNIGAGQNAGEVARGVRAILNSCRQKAPTATVVLTAIFPRNDDMELLPVIQTTNSMLEQLADGQRIRFLNVNSSLADSTGKLYQGVTLDCLHLSVTGYQIWADGLRPILTALLGPKADIDHAPPPTGDPGQGVSTSTRPTV